jgi:hypothetical protein
MWFSIIFNIILSIIIIFIVHQIWEYCKINYTSPKNKNLGEIQAAKYKQMVEDMERNTKMVVPVYSGSSLSSPSSSPLSYPKVETEQTPPLIKLQHSDFLPFAEKEWIHKEMTEFIDTL